MVTRPIVDLVLEALFRVIIIDFFARLFIALTFIRLSWFHLFLLFLLLRSVLILLIRLIRLIVIVVTRVSLGSIHVLLRVVRLIENRLLHDVGVLI